MAETTYSYTISTDIPAGKVDSDSLVKEIADSSIVTALERIDIAGDNLDVVFKAALSAADKTTLDNDTTGPSGGLIGAHTGVAAAAVSEYAKDLHRHLVSTVQLPLGGGFRVISHNFCDPCSWWHESTEHVDQATTTGDDLTFDITGHANLIDLRHGRLTFEEAVDATTVSPGGGGTMTNIVPTVKLNGTPLAQSNEDATSGDDRYTIDYVAGSVTFTVARAGTDTVVVTFRKAGSSKFTFKPDSGKKYILEDAEIDVSEDIDMLDNFCVRSFGSHTVQTGGSVVEVSKKTYKVFHDFQAAARRFWGPIPTNFGGTGGIASPKWTFEWQYARADEIHNTANYVDVNLDASQVTINRVELECVTHTAMGGGFLTVAFYGQEKNESE